MSETTTKPACACMGAGPMITEALRKLGPSEAVSQHFRTAQLEVLKGLRALLDEHINARSDAPRQGTRIPVE